MKRAVFYGRVSTDLQDERSVDDQYRVVRKFTDLNDIVVIRRFEDRGISGATIAARPGIQALLRAAENREFDCVVVEALSRLSRSMRDMSLIKDRLRFNGIEILDIGNGGLPVNTLQAGVQGLFAQMQREETARMVKRGMEPKAANGRSMGGRAYGYHVPELADGVFHTGKLAITEDEAEIVRRIFKEFVAGKTPREIAHDLNRDRIPPPRGKQWNASTINGNGKRSDGILRNEKYFGRLVWNKTRMVLDDRTGKRIVRVNKRDERVIADNCVPAIITTELFEEAQALIRKRALTQAANGFTRHPKRLLSGKLRCGACPGGMSVFGPDRTGRMRIRCSNDKEAGTCPDPKTHYVDAIERNVLACLQGALQEPNRIQKFVDEYHRERRNLMRDTISARAKAERQLRELHNLIDRLTGLLIRGQGDARVLDERIKEAAGKRDQLEAEIVSLSEAPDLEIELHPDPIKRYLEILGKLQPLLEQKAPAIDPDLLIIRELVDRVVVNPDRTLRIEGRLHALTGDFMKLNPDTDTVWGAMVAEEGFEPPTQGL